MPATFLAAVFILQAGAQSPPSAYGPVSPFSAGAQYSNSTASFPYQSGQRLTGAGAFADVRLNYRIGLEGEANFWAMGGFEGSTESTYLAGPKAVLLFRGRWLPYGKLLVGEGRIHYPFRIGDANYLAVAPGAGADYRVRDRWVLRFEYEYQVWPNSPGYANEPKHELTPNGFHVGIAYRILP
ncbi:MAG: outer membrane beta-barrel protein [Acidobacteriaceae bacterium]